MDRLSGTNLAALHEAIVEVSATAFPGVHFEFYREDRKNMPMGTGLAGADPKAYVLMELAEFDAGDMDPGTEQQAMVARFEANIVMKALRTDAKVQVRALAGAFAAFLRRQSRFKPEDVLQGAARVVGCYKDDFSPELDQFEVWRVEWTQDVWFGDATEPAPPIPTQVLFSYVPIVGIPYEPEYMDITGAPRGTS